jgi:signal transduction histidine kinase
MKNHDQSPRLAFYFLSGLRPRLLLLTILAILPTLVLVTFVILQQQQLSMMQAREDLLKQTRASAAWYKQLLEGPRQLLPSLARISVVQNHDGPACTSIFASLLSQYPSYANLAAVDKHGDMFCSVLSLPETHINVYDRNYFQRTLREQSFVVGEFQASRITGDPVVTLAYPVTDSDHKVQGLVFAGLSLNWLNRQVNLLELPIGGSLRLVDRDGNILVHSLAPGQWMGEKIPDAQVWEAMQQRREGWIEAIDTDGKLRLHTFATIQSGADADMYVSLDVPTSMAYAESDQILSRNFIALALVGILALAAGRVGGDLFILRRVNTLLRATQRVANGDLSVRTTMAYEGGELGVLSRAFNQMTENLEQRDTERHHMEQALRASAHRAQALAEAAARLNARLELDDVIHQVCLETAQALSVPASSLCLYDPNHDQFTLVADFGLPPEFRNAMTGISHEVYKTLAFRIGSPLVVTDVVNRPELPYTQLFHSLHIRSMACASMLHQENLVGILSVYSFEPHDFTSEEVILLRGLTEQAALAVVNARLYESLRQQEQMHAQLLRKMITAQEDERMRIARELHDETSQDITALMVGLDTINLAAETNPSKAHTQLETVRGIAKNMLIGIHRLIADLRPSLLDHRGLVPAITWYGDKRLKPLGIELHLEANRTDRLPRSIETCLFRVVQEGITNVVRHSQASQVTVHLVRQEDCVSLRLSDNGQGFDVNAMSATDETGKGFGLQGMRERIRILAGKFDLQSAPGCGTTITILVPLPQHETL